MAPTEGREAKSEGKVKRNKRVAMDTTTPQPIGREVTLHNLVGKNTLRLTLGMTCPNRNCFAVDPASGTAIYPASGVAVLWDTLRCKQIRYIQTSTHSISCVNFSPDGQYILVGEFGHMPALRVWSVALDQQLAEFQGHEYGVAYAAFSGKMDLLVSVGTNHDGTIFVWAWPSREKISCNRFAEVIYATSFSGTDPFFVTCGSHHIRFWYPETKSSRFEPDTLLGRSVIMRDIKTRTYVDVAFGSERSEKFVYSVTTCGLICKINSQRQVTQFHKLYNTELSSVQACDDQLVIASVYGHVHFFNAISLQYRTSVSAPVDASLVSHTLGVQGLQAWGMMAGLRGRMYLGLDNVHKLLTAVMDNGDFCIWDIGDLGDVKRKYFSSGHNKPVSGVDVCLTSHDGARSRETMFSVSHDGTLRQWRLFSNLHVCCETSNTLYTRSYNPRDPATSDTEVITTVKANPAVGLVVIGDSKGLVTAYEAKTLQVMCTIQRHSRGITIIHFYTSTGAQKGAQLMLTGGRDRLINVYDVKKNFHVLNSLCLHSGSISALAVLDGPDYLMVLSSALDRNVILSCSSPEEPYHFTPRQCRHTTSSVVEIRACPATHRAVLGRGNAVLTVIDTRSFKSVCTFRACADPKGQLEKLQVDPRGAILISACSDRTINVMSLPQGMRLACFTGHAAPVSGLVLCSNMRHFVSTSRDGCVFLWAMPARARRRAMHAPRRSGGGLHRAKVKAKRVSRAARPIRSLVELGTRPGDPGKDTSYTTVSSRVSHSSTEILSRLSDHRREEKV